MYIYLSISLSLYTYIYLSLSLYIYIYVSLSLYLSLSIYIYIYVYVYVYIYIYICMCMCIYIYIYIYLSLSIYIYIYICTGGIKLLKQPLARRGGGAGRPKRACGEPPRARSGRNGAAEQTVSILLHFIVRFSFIVSCFAPSFPCKIRIFLSPTPGKSCAGRCRCL